MRRLCWPASRPRGGPGGAGRATGRAGAGFDGLLRLTRPYTLYFSEQFEQIVVQVPRDLAISVAGMRASTRATARVLAPLGVAGVVAEFFRSLAIAQQHDPVGVEQLSGPAQP